jgi:hypothetical protein
MMTSGVSRRYAGTEEMMIEAHDRRRRAMRDRILAITLLAVLFSFLMTAPAWAEKKGVRIEGKALADYVAEQIGKSWAVVVGINDYEHVRPLRYAVADAKAVAQTLRQRGYQVAELYNRQATKEAIEGELTDKLLDRVGEHDRVVIFFSGHGETKTVKGGQAAGLPPTGRGEEGGTGADGH